MNSVYHEIVVLSSSFMYGSKHQTASKTPFAFTELNNLTGYQLLKFHTNLTVFPMLVNKIRDQICKRRRFMVWIWNCFASKTVNIPVPCLISFWIVWMPIKEPERINNGCPTGGICLADSLFYTCAGNERGTRHGCVYTRRFSLEVSVFEKIRMFVRFWGNVYSKLI